MKWLAAGCLLLLLARVATAAEDIDFQAPPSATGAATAAAMRSLAERALPVYENPDRSEFLANLSALQMVAGEYAAADATRQSLHSLRERQKTARPVDLAVIYDLYARARAGSASTGQPFAKTFGEALDESLATLSDRNAFTLTEWLETPLSVYVGNFQRELDRLRGHGRISLNDAVNLSWAYLSYEAFSAFGPFVGKLIAADDARRYAAEESIVAVPFRGRVAVVVVRPKSATQPLPALLEFADDPDARDRARECAADGYAGVVAYPAAGASKAHAHASSGSPGDDLRAVMGWIAKQRWSNGRVGLYGSGASALAAWTAARSAPPQLAALAVSSVAMPVGAKLEPAHEPRRARRGPRRPAHRGHEAKTTRFALLATTGYFDANEAASLAVLSAAKRRDPTSRTQLLIGPYDDMAMQRGTLAVLGGYSIDASAVVDLRALRFEWFDHVLRGAPLPRLLSEPVDFEVMGADAWRHVDSIAAMANWSVRLYPRSDRTDDHYDLSGHEGPRGNLVQSPVTLDPAPETAGGASSPAPSAEDSADLPAILARTLEPGNGVVFVSGPLHRPLEVSGRVSGALDLAARLVGLTVDVELFELRPGGDYFRFLSLSEPLCRGCTAARASERSRRPLTRRVAFVGESLTSVELHTGSRIVLRLEAHAPAPVETRRARAKARASAALPPTVRWLTGTFVELPVWRAPRS